MKILFIVLSGGKGTRLRPVTFFKQKTLFPTMKGGRIIDYAIGSGNIHDIPGIEGQIIVLARHKSNQVIRYVQKKYSDVTILVESMSLDTGGAILQHWQTIRKHNPEVVIVLNGDHLIQLPVESLLHFYQKNRPALLMVGIPSDEERHDYININFDSERVLNNFSTRKSKIAYTGISLFRFDVLNERMNYLPIGTCNITMDIVEWIYARYGGNYYTLKNEWDDLGTWKRYLGFLFREFKMNYFSASR